MKKVDTKKDEKICPVCGEVKPKSDYYKRSSRPCGVQSRCIVCQKKIMSNWGKLNKDKKRKMLYDWKLKNPKRVWALKTLHHHKHAGIIVNITVDDILKYVIKKETCELCGKTINWFNSVTSHDSPTLDRKDNDAFINLTNFQLLCHECNTAKGNKTQREFIDYCKLIVEVNK